ncbi:MAG: hypothetical protein ACLFUM_08910 [Spirochaetaceae bacterium]
MAKRLLIAGKPSDLTEELIREARTAGYEVVATLDEDSEERPNYEGQLRWVRWRVRSPLSARTVVLQAAGVDGAIDEALVIHTPSASAAREPLHDLQSALLEQAVDASVKGALFILRELLGHFERRRAGSLGLVLYQPDGAMTAPLDASTAGAFQGLAGGLFAYYRNEPVTLRGFSATEPQPAEFAGYILQTLAEGRGEGKWNRFSARGGIFSRLR